MMETTVTQQHYNPSPLQILEIGTALNLDNLIWNEH